MSASLAIGRAIGYVGAYTVHGVVSGATGAVNIAQEVALGAAGGYTEHNARLSEARVAARAARPSQLQALLAAPAVKAKAK